MGTSGMNPVGPDPIDLMVQVIQEHSPVSIWTGSPLEGYRRLGNTNRGQIGEDFIRRYLAESNIPVGNGSRVTLTDLQIATRQFELKTASLGANGTFQFNHVRLDRPYNYLLCLGVCPDSIVFQAWRKGVVAEGGAGSLVRMAEGQSTTHKIIRRLADMRPIEEVPTWIRQEVMEDGESSQ
jgi:hypothetical protein